MLVHKNRKKIIPYICGGIGNQLFIYAAARRMSIVNDVELVLDDQSGFLNDFEFKRFYQLDNFNIPCRKANKLERLEPLGRIRRYLIKKFQILCKKRILLQNGVDFNSWILNYRPTGITYIEGYWQSEKYFKDCENQIRDELVIIPPTDNLNLYFSKIIESNNSIALHVRFFDSTVSGKDVSGGLNTNYYFKAIEYIKQRINSPHFYIFSDDPERALSIIPLEENQFTLIKHNIGDKMAYADLWLMSKCKHFIIANSTFSWWGAWLSINHGKIVIAPGFIKHEGNSFWGFDGLLPDNWIKL